MRLHPHRPTGRRLTRLALAGALACAAGCASVRRAREAQRDTRPLPGERTPTAAEVGLQPGRPLSLDDAAALAHRIHPSLAQSRRNLAAAAARLRQAGAARRPQVEASVNGSRRTSNVEGKPSSTGTSRTLSGSLGLDLLLYDFGKTPAAIRQAAADEIAARETLRAAEQTVRFNVRTAFFELGKAQELRQVAEEAARQYEEHLRQVQAFADVGQRTRYDVTKAEVDLGNARLTLMDAVNAEASARAALTQSLGLADEPGYRLGAGALEEVAGDVAAWLERARERHPDLAALRAREAAASAAVDEAIADLYPALRLNASYSGSGRNFPLIWNASAALQAALTVFDGRARSARIDQAVAELRTARARQAEREQQLFLALRQALSARDTARQRLDLSALILREAQESLALVRERYRLGKASAVEVTDAQVAVTTAQADQVKAHFDWLSAVAKILYTRGDENP